MWKNFFCSLAPALQRRRRLSSVYWWCHVWLGLWGPEKSIHIQSCHKESWPQWNIYHQVQIDLDNQGFPTQTFGLFIERLVPLYLGLFFWTKLSTVWSISKLEPRKGFSWSSSYFKSDVKSRESVKWESCRMVSWDDESWPKFVLMSYPTAWLSPSYNLLVFPTTIRSCKYGLDPLKILHLRMYPILLRQSKRKNN